LNKADLIFNVTPLDGLNLTGKCHLDHQRILYITIVTTQLKTTSCPIITSDTFCWTTNDCSWTNYWFRETSVLICDTWRAVLRYLEILGYIQLWGRTLPFHPVISLLRGLRVLGVWPRKNLKLQMLVGQFF